MTVFRASAAFLLVGFAVTALPQTAARADNSVKTASEILIAQAGPAPIRLGPRRDVQMAPTLPDEPVQSPSQPSPSIPVFPSEGGGGPVQVEILKDIDGDSIGTLGDAQGGLGASMWQGAERVFVERLIALLPERQRSPAMRAIIRRLLLTSAAAPPRRGAGPSLLALRIGTLFASGDLTSALELIAAAPVGQIEESLVRTEVEARLFRFDTSGACDIVRGPAQEYRGLYWQQAGAFCLALSDRREEAALMSDVLAERSEAVHPSFFAAMERLGGAAPPVVESLSDPTALNIAMMRAANLSLPGDVTENASPSALHAIALSPNAPVALRLVAAEAAASLGVLSPPVLLQIYGAVTFEAGDLEQAADRVDANWGPKGRALVVRAAVAAQSSEERARLLQKGFAVARAKGGAQIMFIAAQPVLAQIQPSDGLAWFAVDAARAFVTVGDIDKAAAWLAIARKEGARPALRADALPLIALMSAPQSPSDGNLSLAEPGTDLTIRPAPSPRVTSAVVREWRQTLDQAGIDVAQRARVLFSLLEALSVSVPSGSWALVLDRVETGNIGVPSAGIRNALYHAARTRSRGAAAGLAMVAIGPDGPGADTLPAVEQAIRALSAVALTAEARQLALEAAVAAGL